MNIKELKGKLKVIKDKGWVISMRKGNTGIGYTLESLLNIKENNLKTADFGNIELKSQRKGVSNRVTMFTFNKWIWKINQKELIEKYGYIDATGRKALYCTVSCSPNQQGLYLNVGENTLRLYHVDGLLLAEWNIENLIKTFHEKMPALVVVFADTRMNSEGKEEFWFNEAYFLEGVDVDNFINLLSKDIIVIDIRMHLKKNNVVRNHGTGFRIDEKFLSFCFAKKERLI